MASTLKKLHEGKAERSQATLTVAGASEAGEAAGATEGRARGRPRAQGCSEPRGAAAARPLFFYIIF